MKKYIERESVIRLIQTEGFNEKYDLGDKKDNDWFCEEVNRIPAADVVEARHGEWKFDGEDWFCNKCNHNALCDKDTGEVVLSNACPNCGARMDGGADE